MIRISDLDMVCPMCQKNDWCLVSDDGSACICTRVSEGAAKKCGKAGWLHILKPGEFAPKKHKQKPKPPINWQALIDLYVDKLRNSSMVLDIGIKQQTLADFCIGWTGDAFSFPMRDETTLPVGMQVRFRDGKKMTVKGSQVGLFIPNEMRIEDILVICEGLSDTAVFHELGIAAIGRYNCNSCGEMILNYLKWLPQVPNIVLVGDNDPAGMDGVKGLKELLLHNEIESLVVAPSKYNDVREAYTKGGLTKDRFYQILRKQLETKHG